MHTFLACFDITNDRNRREVGMLLEQYGVRVQRSVFEIALDSLEELAHLKVELAPLVESTDDLRFYHLCLNCRQQSADLTNQRIAHFPTWIVV